MNKGLKEAWSKIIAKCWTDENFKKELIENPDAVLKEYGIQLKPNTKVVIYENDDRTFYLVLPNKPSGDISEKMLSEISAGEGSSAGCVCQDCR